MKRLLPLFVFFIAGLIGATETPSSGGVSTDYQAWAGRKAFQANALNARGALSGNVTLLKTDSLYQSADPNGSNRDMTLPAVELTGLDFIIANVGSANSLIVKDPSGSTIVTIAAAQVGFVSCTGTAWIGYVYSGPSTTGFLPADGSVVGATGAAQDFGALGIKADSIIGSTGTTGNFKLKLTDNLASSLDITEASNSYLKFVTTDAGEKIQLGKDLDLPAARKFTLLDNSSAALDITESTNSYLKFITTDSGEKIQLGKDLDCPAARSITLLDNNAAALTIKEATNAYLTFITTDSGEQVKTSKTLNVAGPLLSTPATVQDLSNSSTITLPTAQFTQRLTASGGAVTGIILTAGTSGQVVTLINADTANSITFAASGTSHVADGASSVIAAKTAMVLVYDGTTSLWYHCK